MTTGNVGALVDEESNAPASTDTPLQVPPPHEAAEVVARPVASLPTAPTVHERRLLAVRDINTRIEGLERDIAGLTERFSESRDVLRTHVDDLQHRSVTLMAEVLRVNGRMDQAERLQAEEAQALEARLTGSVVALGQELGKAVEALGQQKRWLGQLQADQEVLGKLHDHLAKVGGHHEDMIRELGAETRQQLRISRTHIDGLHALYREQHGELQKLAADHALLDEKSRVLAEQLQGLNAVVADHATQTGRRLRRLGGAVAVLAVVSLGLIAWFQFKPTAVPESVTFRLAGLSAGLQGQTSRSESMRTDLAQVHQGMAVLAQQMQDQALAMAGLRAESHRTGREMQAARVALTALKSQVGTLQGQVQSMRPDVTESGRPDGAAASR